MAETTCRAKNDDHKTESGSTERRSDGAGVSELKEFAAIIEGKRYFKMIDRPHAYIGYMYTYICARSITTSSWFSHSVASLKH